MKIQEAATIYRGQGWPVIPINPRNKKPLIPWSEFQNRVPSSVEFDDWLQKWPDLMIGIVTGEKSGILVIDCDSKEAYQKIQEYLPENLLTPVSRKALALVIIFIFNIPRAPASQSEPLFFPESISEGKGASWSFCCPPSKNGTKTGYSWLHWSRHI